MLDDKKRAFQLASVFLQYPSETWYEFDAINAEISQFENIELRRSFQRFVDYLKTKQLIEVCSEYVQTFDFNDKTTLYISYSYLGEQLERGEALVQLKELYRNGDLEMTSRELPDFLPIVLEYASLVNEEKANQIFKIYKKSIENLELELESANSPYRNIVSACKTVINDYPGDEAVGGGESC